MKLLPIFFLLLSCSKPILTVSIPDVPEVIQSEQPLFKLGMPFETGSTVEDTKSMPVWVPVVLEAPAKRVLCSERIVVCVDTFSCDSLFRVCDRMLKKIDSLCCVADKIVKDNESFDLKYDQRKWQDTKRDVVLAIWITGILGSVLLVVWLIDKNKK